MYKINSNSLVASYNTIKSKPIDWLWYPYIAFGKITIVLGDPGEGKTSFVLYLASLLSNNDYSKLGLTQEAIKIIYQSAEDGMEDTVKPRLDSYKANCKNIYFMTSKDISLTCEELESAIKQAKARLLILDPLQSFMEKGTSLQNVADLRPIFNHLSKVAKRTNCAIVLVGHMNKAIGSKELYRGLGSIDIVAVARSVLTVKRIEENSKTRVVSQIKNNLADIGMPVAFDIKMDGTILWLGKTSVENYQIEDDIGKKKEKKASILLLDILKDGPKLTSLILCEAKINGISERTMRSAKKELNIIALKRKDGWYWSLREESDDE